MGVCFPVRASVRGRRIVKQDPNSLSLFVGFCLRPLANLPPWSSEAGMVRRGLASHMPSAAPFVVLADDPMLSLAFVERMDMTIKALDGGRVS